MKQWMIDNWGWTLLMVAMVSVTCAWFLDVIVHWKECPNGIGIIKRHKWRFHSEKTERCPYKNEAAIAIWNKDRPLYVYDRKIYCGNCGKVESC